MLVIRMQRTGRKGHAMFRVVVQDSRRTPSSGKVVAALGSYDPHAKTIQINKDKTSFYLEHGAQPSDRAARLLQAEGIELPNWVKLSAGKQGSIRNAEKRRSTTPASEPAEEPVEVIAAEKAVPAEASVDESEPEAEPESIETEAPAIEPEIEAEVPSTDDKA